MIIHQEEGQVEPEEHSLTWRTIDVRKLTLSFIIYNNMLKETCYYEKQFLYPLLSYKLKLIINTKSIYQL